MYTNHIGTYYSNKNGIYLNHIGKYLNHDEYMLESKIFLTERTDK